MAESRDRGWRIYHGYVLLGAAYFRAQDQPFYICSFEPAPAFENYRYIFDKYATLVDNPNPAHIISDYYEENIEALNLLLIPFGDVWPKVFVVQIYDANEAWLRPL